MSAATSPRPHVCTVPCRCFWLAQVPHACLSHSQLCHPSKSHMKCCSSLTHHPEQTQMRTELRLLILQTTIHAQPQSSCTLANLELWWVDKCADSPRYRWSLAHRAALYRSIPSSTPARRCSRGSCSRNSLLTSPAHRRRCCQCRTKTGRQMNPFWIENGSCSF